MKKILFLFLLVTGITKAQIVNIPDANFKAKLLAADTTNQIAYINYGTTSAYGKIDVNSDGEIQQSEVLNVIYLNISNANITNLSGIEYFTNVQYLNCANNQLSSLDVSSNLLLNNLVCYSNQLTSLNINSNTSLSQLFCSSNQLSTLDVSHNTGLNILECYNNHLTNLNIVNNNLLQSLNCINNQLSSLNVSNNTGLTLLDCAGNHLTNLNVNSNTALTRLNCADNQLTSLNINNNTALNTLWCYSNQLTSINVNSNTALSYFLCNSNQLTTLNLTNNTALTQLDCSNNLFSNLDVSHNTQLNYFWCKSNQLTTININNNSALTNFNCSSNQLTNINVNNNTLLAYFDCSYNQLTSLDLNNNALLTQQSNCTNNLLVSLYIKNGVIDDFNFYNPTLQFICADENEFNLIQTYISLWGLTACTSNSYCSFNPGGNYNIITGNVKFDANNNGCDANDLPQPNIRVNINDGTNTGATFTNNLGNYKFYTQAGNFILTPDIENPTWFNFSPTTATIPFANTNNNTTTQNFCIVANGIHNDLEVVIEPIISARPGFNATYKVVFKNKGNQTLSGDVNFTYDDSVLDFVSATVLPNSQNTGILSWNYINLLPFENRSFYVTLYVNAPTATPPVNIGDSLMFNATITPLISDENPLDNNFSYRQIVVGSLDPNDITCLEGAVVSPSQIGNYLHYGVNFENIGTASAQNVVVKVVIDTTKYDVNSLQLLNTSNPAYVKITGNVAEFIFQNINLAATSGTPPVGGHGDVLFKIKSLSSLISGDMVGKTADIFFDYNAPINTGMANTTFQLLNNGQFVIDNSITTAPNPTSSILNINSNSVIKSIQLYDVQGRILQTSLEDSTTSTIDMSGKQNGIYFLKITTEKGSKVEKIVKE